jgi:lipid II:glycine glycyltransferase (peptidoglycan interpeptide bridge formation enzyme)
MITLNPLPKFSHLIKSLFIRSDLINNDKPWIRNNRSVQFWFSKSRFSILTIIKWYEKLYDNPKPIIWFPDYFCNEPIAFLKEFDFTLNFYPVMENLNPNWDLCETLAISKKPDIFFLVHYFGECNDIGKAKSFCDDIGCIFVEDAAHVLEPFSEIGKFSDFTFFSQHKLFAIPDGALLIHNPKLKNLGEKNSIEVLNEVVEALPNNSPSSIKWLIKRSLQKILPDFLRLKKNKDQILNTAKIKYSPFQSKLSKRLLHIQKKYVSDYANLRKRNASGITIGFNDPNQALKDYVPYMTKVEFNNSNEAEKYYSQKGSLLMKWPDFPNEIISELYTNKIPIQVRNNRIFFPSHQSINMNSVRRMRKILNNNKNEKYSKLKISSYNINKKDLDNYISEAGWSNYLQSWVYGNAKQEVQGWQVKRLLIKSDKTPIAVCQILIKVIAGVKICRINRGPIFISNQDSAIKLNVFQFLKSKYNLLHRSILFINPEFENNSENISIMKLLKYRLIGKTKWNSSVLDLQDSVENLRKNLNGKWRNQLKKSETFNIKMEYGNSENSYYWLMGQYKKLMIDKSFKGPSVELYNNIFINEQKSITIFRVFHDGKPVAGQMYIKHGKTSTYLVGYNSEFGRKMYLHNYLIWNAIIVMKSENISWFDLGGIDIINNPGVAKFKLGVEGKKFSLIGDWINW